MYQKTDKSWDALLGVFCHFWHIFDTFLLIPQAHRNLKIYQKCVKQEFLPWKNVSKKWQKFVFWLIFVTFLESVALIAWTVLDFIKYLGKAHETLSQRAVHWILALGRICGLLEDMGGQCVDEEKTKGGQSVDKVSKQGLL